MESDSGGRNVKGGLHAGTAVQIVETTKWHKGFRSRQLQGVWTPETEKDAYAYP